MLTSLRIQHFRTWRDTGPITLAPLTVFFGEHGTGKSSLGHALSLLDQAQTAHHTQVEVTGLQAGIPYQREWTHTKTPASTAYPQVTFIENTSPLNEAVQPSIDSDLTPRWLTAMGFESVSCTRQTSHSAQHAGRLLTHLFNASADSTVWLEHPENHLHPKVQAVLMDALIAAVQLGVQCIVESHSEAFLNRLQRRVAEEVISPKDISLYVCRRQNAQAELEPLRLNRYGDIENWPDDLFGHDMTDITARTLAALRRRHADEQDVTP